MTKYHRYVFDLKNRRFVGEFEAMYAAEAAEQFDSWHQDDSRHLNRRVLLNVLAGYNFDRVLDIGCGKGGFSHLLKRANNSVTAVDLAPTAIQVAAARYPDLDFRVEDVSAPQFDPAALGGPFDLIAIVETLSYLPEWRALLGRCAAATRFIAIVLDIPADPIGHVKTFDELVAEIERHFRIIEEIRLVTRHQVVVFAETFPRSTR